MRSIRADRSGGACRLQPHALFVALLLLLPFLPGTGLTDADTHPPTLRIVEPTTGTELAGAALTVEIEYRDTGSGIAPQTLRVWLDGKDYAGHFDQHNRGASGQMRLPKSLPIGDHKLTVEIADRAGNVARADTLVLYGGPPEAQYNAGLVHAQAGRWKEAEASFSKAVKFNPKDAAAYMQLGHAYQRLQRYADAITAYRQAITLRPGDFTAYLSLGDVSVRIKDYAGATQAYRHATDIDPKNAQAYKSLALACRMDKKYVEAKQALRTARRLDPTDAEIYADTGLVELAQKHYLFAELNFRRAVLVNPKSTPAYLGLGDAFFEQARYEQAVEAFNAALQVDPMSEKARFGLGMAYLKLKDRAKALEQVPLLAEVNKALSEELNRRLTE